MTKPMQLMLITRVPEIALEVEEAGVDTIFVDMETRGKIDRQKNANTPIYEHSFEDVTEIKKVLSSSEVLLRINPLYDGTENEVERAIDSGADAIMLPFFQLPEEVGAGRLGARSP